MALNIYEPIFMLPLVRELGIEYTFVRERYFNGDTTLFKQEKVLVDYDDGTGRILAPFVIPTVGAVPMTRDGYETYELVPPYISVSLPLTEADLNRRMAGENIISTVTPDQRARTYLAKDLNTLSMAITRREEWMCVQTMLDNECVMKHIGDNGNKGKDMIARYYNGTNPGVFTPSAAWARSTDDGKTPGTWFGSVKAQLSDMRQKGRNATELLVGSQVAELITGDPWIWKMLDNRRAELGEIDPRWQAAGVTRIGKLNFGGQDLEIFVYEGTYEEQDIKTRKKTVKPYFPPTAAVLTEPNSGKLCYGAVTQKEQDGQWHTRAQERVPKHIDDVKHNSEETIMTSRPIACPKIKSPWRSCRNVFDV